MLDLNLKRDTLEKWEITIFWATILFSLGFFLFIAFDRSYFNYGTETDTIGGFIPEAKRILNGQPLALNFHPPLYSFALSIAFSISKHWLYAGIAISIISACIVYLSTYFTFKPMVGKLPAIWACIVTATSPVFLSYATQATTDLYFFALYSLTIWSAFHSFNSNSIASWLATGCLIALTVLTRANGVILLLLLALPLFANIKVPLKIKLISTCLTGIVICCGIWVIYALITDSNLSPGNNYRNVAMTYFGTGNQISYESLNSIPENINSLFDVFIYDPKSFLMIYAKDFYLLFADKLYTLLVFPFSKIVFAGILLIAVLCWKNKNLFLYTTITVAHILLINLKTFEPRYYMFLIPLFGIGIGMIISSLIRLLPSTKITQFASAAIVVGFIIVSFWTAQSQAINWTYKNRTELNEFLPIAHSLIKDDDFFIARKNVIGFHTNSITPPYPNKNSIKELKQAICSNLAEKKKNIWLFYGAEEIKKRKQYQELLDPTSHDFFIPAAQGKQSKWVLYKVLCDKNL